MTNKYELFSFFEVYSKPSKRGTGGLSRSKLSGFLLCFLLQFARMRLSFCSHLHINAVVFGSHLSYSFFVFVFVLLRSGKTFTWK